MTARRPKLVTYRTDSDNPKEAYAFRVIDPCWPVEIRQAMHVVAG